MPLIELSPAALQEQTSSGEFVGVPGGGQLVGDRKRRRSGGAAGQVTSSKRSKDSAMDSLACEMTENSFDGGQELATPAALGGAQRRSNFGAVNPNNGFSRNATNNSSSLSAHVKPGSVKKLVIKNLKGKEIKEIFNRCLC